MQDSGDATISSMWTYATVQGNGRFGLIFTGKEINGAEGDERRTGFTGKAPSLEGLWEPGLVTAKNFYLCPSSTTHIYSFHLPLNPQQVLSRSHTMPAFCTWPLGIFKSSPWPFKNTSGSPGTRFSFISSCCLFKILFTMEFLRSMYKSRENSIINPTYL